jgi:hypothetical protein
MEQGLETPRSGFAPKGVMRQERETAPSRTDSDGLRDPAQDANPEHDGEGRIGLKRGRGTRASARGLSQFHARTTSRKPPPLQVVIPIMSLS